MNNDTREIMTSAKIGPWASEKMKKKTETNKHHDLPGTVFRRSDSNKVRLYNQNFRPHTTHRQASFLDLPPLHLFVMYA